MFPEASGNYSGTTICCIRLFSNGNDAPQPRPLPATKKTEPTPATKKTEPPSATKKTEPVPSNVVVRVPFNVVEPAPGPKKAEPAPGPKKAEPVLGENVKPAQEKKQLRFLQERKSWGRACSEEETAADFYSIYD